MVFPASVKNAEHPMVPCSAFPPPMSIKEKIPLPVRTRNAISQCACQGGSLKCGSVSTYRAGCGCDPCRTAHNERIKTNAERRRSTSDERRATSSTTRAVTPVELDLSAHRARRASRQRVAQALGQVWRPRGWAPLERDPLPSGPKWREDNLGPWCTTHHDWAFREGANHDQSERACQFKEIS